MLLKIVGDTEATTLLIWKKCLIMYKGYLVGTEKGLMKKKVLAIKKMYKNIKTSVKIDGEQSKKS